MSGPSRQPAGLQITRQCRRHSLTPIILFPITALPLEQRVLPELETESYSMDKIVKTLDVLMPSDDGLSLTAM